MSVEKPGTFIISLDFELYWGVFDKLTKENYGNNILATHEVVPKLLRVFNKYNIAATWATVGMLFNENKEQLMANNPDIKPMYENPAYSAYDHLEKVGNNIEEDRYHYCGDLIDQIKVSKNQELASHTYSHYYCLEKGQNEKSFAADSKAIIKLAKEKGIEIKSLVFPRNQYNEAYLKICADHGLIAYRGNQKSWIYKERIDSNQSLIQRLSRLINNYFNITGDQSSSLSDLVQNNMVNIPATRFLRPYNKTLAFLEKRRLGRIKKEMTLAAKKGNVYHLWWHPHNFGNMQNENFTFLESLLKHFTSLQKDYHFQSKTMKQLAQEILDECN